jgi:hypothetical protein
VEDVLSFFQKEMAVYPNPTNEDVTVAFRLDQPSMVNLTIYDLTGRIVWQETQKNYGAGAHSVELNVAERGLTNGTYLVNLTSAGTSMTQQLVVAGN